MIMNVSDFIKEYNEGYYAEDIIETLMSSKAVQENWDNEELEKEIDNMIDYGKIEILYDEEDNEIKYTLGYSDLGIKELNLSHYNKIENQDVWDRDYLDNENTLNNIPNELIKKLKEEN